MNACTSEKVHPTGKSHLTHKNEINRCILIYYLQRPTGAYVAAPTTEDCEDEFLDHSFPQPQDPPKEEPRLLHSTQVAIH